MGKTLGYGEITVANMTEPFTVMLTNEAQQFATDSNRKVTSAQSYYTDIIVIRGSQERTDYTIGNITSSSGITVSKSSKRVTFSVSAGTTIGADTGVIEIPITLDGQTVKKQFSWSCGKQGPQGVQGNDGNSFAWNMLSETNCGKKHWGTESSGGKYSVEDFITEDNINAVKLICTEGISTSNWSYVLFKDIKMLKQLKPSTKYTLSYDIKANRSGAISHSICKGDVSNFCTNIVVVNNIIGNETWQHISVVLTTNDLKTTPTNEILYLGRNALSKVGYSIIKNLKLVEGDINTPWSPSQSDIEGKGVVETIQYYLATSQASGVTSSTSGWSTDITTQKLTADKKYLWNCYQTKYSDGTSEPISTPKVIGVYGDKGNGIVASVQRPNKTEFWWSQVGAVGHKDTFDDSSNTRNNCRVGDIFTVMGTSTEGNSHTVYYKSTTDSGDLAGECINHVVAESGADAKNLTITPSSQYFKSTDGGKTFAPNAITIKPTIQGEISFGKWQYSIDGGVSFADVVSGQKGLTVSNNVLAVSKDSSLYSDAVTMVTFRAVANDSSFYDTCSIAKIYDVSDIQIGGRNLLWNSGTATAIQNSGEWNAHGCTATTETRNNCLVSRVNSAWNGYQFNLKKIIERYNLVDGDILTYSIDVKMDEPIDILFVNNYYADNKGCTGGISTVNHWDGKYFTIGKWERLSFTFKITQDTLDKIATDTYRQGVRTAFEPIKATSVGKYVYFACPKLERGTKPTDWTPAPEDVQTAILSTKSEISDVSLKVDKNKQAIEQRVEKTTYQQDLNLVKGDISKANEGLNKWRYEIYPKSLFDSTDQGKSTIDIFAKNKNLTPSRTVLFNDTDLSIQWNSAENYIGYALTFTKFSAAKSVAITFAHDDGAHIYLNGKLIGGSDAYSQTGESLTLGFVKGWNCIEVVVNDKNSYEGFTLGTTISAISECQLMNCYYGTPVARQSHITNQLVENTTNIDGISTKVSKVTSVIGEGGENFTSFKNEYSDFKQTMNGFKTTVSQTYVTKDDFNGLEIGGRNLLLYSQTIRAHKDYYGVGWLTDEVETFNGCPVWSVKNQWGRLTWLFKSHVIDRGLVKVGDTLTYSLYAKTNNASGKSINCSYRFKGNANAYWFNGSAFNVGTNWTRYSVTFTITKDMLATDTYMTEIGFEETASMSGDDKVYYACPKLERGTKATDYTPALEDNEINGQNLVSNLSSNWEQGSVSYVANSTYASIKTVLATRLRTEDVFSVSGNVTISAGTSTNSSKEELNFYYVLFDVNKKAIGVPASGSEWQSLTSPKIINCGDAKYMAIILRWGSGSTVITPSNISQICLKIERGTSATPFTLAPEDVNGKIVNAETIANQTANKFSWIVKSGTSASNFEITDKFMNLVSTNINLDGIVSFMNTAKGDGRKNLYNLDYSSFENVASQEDAICYAKDNGVTSVGIDSSVSYDGDKSLKISYTTANLNSSTTPLYLGSFANNYGCVKIQAGKQYILSCYVKSDSTTGLFMIDIQGHDTPDTKTDGLYLSNIDPRKLPGSSTGVNLSTDWQRAVCAIKVADNATGLYWSVVPLIWGRPSSSSAPQTFNVWVDCIMLEEVDSISNEPGTYIFDKETIIDGGSIKTDTITGNQILAGSITADKIATDAIKSHNYISSGGTQGSFLNLGDGSFTSPNLSWDANGNLIAKNANIIGNLTAGTVGEWKIDKYIYSKDKVFFDINKHNGQSIYNKNSTNNLFLGDGKVSSFYWFTTQNNTFIIENGNSPQYATGPAGISFGTNIAQGQIELYESVFPGKIIPDYETTSHTSELSISGSKISFSYYDSNGSSFSDSPYTYIMADYARFYGDIFVQGSITTDEGVDVGGKLQASSIAAKNGGLIETSGTIYGGGEIQCGGGQMRIIGGDYGILLRNDGSDFYILSTDSGNQWGYWNSKRPFRINLANGIPYFEYGIIIPNENYLLGNGYQLGRGTSWGGVCLGDNSKQLRLYGTSIWASHSISTSDENLKENFTTLDQYEDFYMNLNPIGFNYIGDYDGKKTHFGFGAHKTEDILESEGYNSDKFAVVTRRPLVQEDIEKRFGKDVEVDIEMEYGVSYTEFIALNTHMIQKTRRELEQVKQEKADLETRLQAIEAKLGL